MGKSFFNGISITVESTGETFHTLRDWSLYIKNSDYIKEPKQYTKYIEIPGRSGLLDVSEAISGRQIYTERQILVELSGIREKQNWDGVISAIRNKINGKVCRLIFDNDNSFYWRGRVAVKDFSSILRIGSFKLEVKAEPYKYGLTTSAEEWDWDPFDFETGMIIYIEPITVTDSENVIIPPGQMLTCPDFIISSKLSAQFTVSVNGEEFSLSEGTNRIPSIMVGGDDETELTFSGSAVVEIVYRSGSL